MNITTLEAPAAEPVGLAEAKDWLRIGNDDQDELVGAMIAAARARVEEVSGLALIARTLRVTMSRWTSGVLETRRVRLPVRPAAALVAVRVYPLQGEASDVTERFALEAGRAARLVWASGPFPWPGRRANGIEVDYVAGFGAGPEDVAEGLRLAVKRLLAHAWLTRDVETLAKPLPEDAAELLAPWRRVRL